MKACFSARLSIAEESGAGKPLAKIWAGDAAQPACLRRRAAQPMSWIAVIWGPIAGICLALVGMHLPVWFQPNTWATFFFSLNAAGASVTAIIWLTLVLVQTLADDGSPGRPLQRCV